MSMSMHVEGFKAPDDRHVRMGIIWHSCIDAGVPVPREVEDYFGGQAPDPEGVTVELPAKPWSDEYREGYQLAVGDIPDGVSVLRFYASW